jgi:hypothetical protein
MRVRTVTVGVVCGWICVLALRSQYLKIEMHRFVPGWPGAETAARIPPWSATAILLLCGFVLFAGGWVVARWNWAENWRRSLQAGSGMGFLAGCLIFDFVNTTWAGVRGHAAIFANFYDTFAPEVGAALLSSAMLQTGKLLYANLFLQLLAGTVLGGLGGIVSNLVDREDRWGSDPRNPQGWLFRMPTYLLALFGLINNLIGQATLRYLLNTLNNTVEQAAELSSVSADQAALGQFSLLSNLSLWLFSFLPLGITWGWILRIWRKTHTLQILSVVWLIITTIGVLVLFWFIAPDLLTSLPDMFFLLAAWLLGVYIGFTTEQRTEGFAYRVSDWVGYSIGYGVLSGTQLLSGVAAIAITFATLTIGNIDHFARMQPVDVTDTPVAQVTTFGAVQLLAGLIGILGSILLALVIAGFVSFLRTILGIKDVALLSDEEHQVLGVEP